MKKIYRKKLALITATVLLLASGVSAALYFGNESQDSTQQQENSEQDGATPVDSEGTNQDATAPTENNSSDTNSESNSNTTPERQIPLDEVPEEQKVDDRGGGVYY